jgi:starch phosphorylase
MRESMAQLTPRFSTTRAVREYTEQQYLPAAAAYRERAANDGARGLDLVRWRRQLEQSWFGLRFGAARVETEKEHHTFEVQVYLGALDPDAVRVELYADGVAGGGPERQQMRSERQADEGTRASTYRARVAATRPATDYTARLIPWCEGVAVPLEANYISWQR